MGIGIAFLLGAGRLAMAVLGEAPLATFQNLVYWACFLLICAVHELSKRTDKTAVETNALRGEIEGARGEIRRLQADLRELQGSQRATPRLAVPSPMNSVPSVVSGASALASVPRAAALAETTSKTFEALWGPVLLALIFLLIKFWPEVGALVQNVLQGPVR